jgi:hypothetical protein
LGFCGERFLLAIISACCDAIFAAASGGFFGVILLMASPRGEGRFVPAAGHGKDVIAVQYSKTLLTIMMS